MISRLLTTVAFAVTFSVGFGFADVGSGVVVRIGVVFWGDGGVVDDVTVVVGDGVFDVDDVAAGVVLVFFGSSGTTSHDSLCCGVSQHASSNWLKQHQHSFLLSTAERSADGAKDAAV
jgi:hypothetical protein